MDKRIFHFLKCDIQLQEIISWERALFYIPDVKVR